MIRTAQDMRTYKQQIRESLENKFLRATLDNFGASYKASRANAFENMDFEAIRNDIAKAKDEALPLLETLLKKFRKNAERAGAKVHFATDAEHANQIIAGIAKDNGVRKIVKSKSMTAEEIFLNASMEEQGFQVTETDLGE